MIVLKNVRHADLGKLKENGEPIKAKSEPRYQFIVHNDKKFRVCYFNQLNAKVEDRSCYTAELLTDSGWITIASKEDIGFNPTLDTHTDNLVYEDAERFFYSMRVHISMLY